MVQENEQKKLRRDIEQNVIAGLDSLSREQTIALWQVFLTQDVYDALEQIRYDAAESLAVAPTRVIP